MTLNDHPHVLGEVPRKGLAQFEQPLLLVFAFGQPGELLAHLRQSGGRVVDVRIPFGGVMLRGQQDATWRGKPAEILYHFDSSSSPRREVRYPCKVWCYPLTRPVKCQPAGPSRLWRGERSAGCRTGPSSRSPGRVDTRSPAWLEECPDTGSERPGRTRNGSDRRSRALPAAGKRPAATRAPARPEPGRGTRRSPE